MASKDGTKVVDEVARQVRNVICLYMYHVDKLVERNESPPLIHCTLRELQQCAVALMYITQQASCTQQQAHIVVLMNDDSR